MDVQTPDGSMADSLEGGSCLPDSLECRGQSVLKSISARREFQSISGQFLRTTFQSGYSEVNQITSGFRLWMPLKEWVVRLTGGSSSVVTWTYWGWKYGYFASELVRTSMNVLSDCKSEIRT